MGIPSLTGHVQTSMCLDTGLCLRYFRHFNLQFGVRQACVWTQDWVYDISNTSTCNLECGDRYPFTHRPRADKHVSGHRTVFTIFPTLQPAIWSAVMGIPSLTGHVQTSMCLDTGLCLRYFRHFNLQFGVRQAYVWTQDWVYDISDTSTCNLECGDGYPFTHRPRADKHVSGHRTVFTIFPTLQPAIWSAVMGIPSLTGHVQTSMCLDTGLGLRYFRHFNLQFGVR
ncbi:hypothetical protein J6590_032239 [Homalodisca vitripennis]|nr:hypothetical protein J6590_032239 [Homalodisca vitripennis]